MDIRQLYNSLSPEDKALYQKIRTDIRKVYLNAHTNILGMDHWKAEDDALLDLLDIKVAILFDRGGSINSIKEVINKEEINKIEQKIEEQGVSVASKMLVNHKENGKLETW